MTMMKCQQPQQDPLLGKSMETEDSVSVSGRSVVTVETHRSQDSPSSSSEASAAELKLDESRHIIRKLRREAKARATELARLRIQVEALSAERESMKRYRDVCESAMADARDLRVERDELREILLNVMNQEGQQGQEKTNAKTAQESFAEQQVWDEQDYPTPMAMPERRRTSNFSTLSDDDEQERDSTRDSTTQRISRARRSSLLEGVGGFFSGVVKNVSSKSLSSLGAEVSASAEALPQQSFNKSGARPDRVQQRRASAVVTSALQSSFRSLTSIGEELSPGASNSVELNDIKTPSRARATRHASMPILKDGNDSASSLSSWNVKEDAEQDEKNNESEASLDFLSWEDSRKSAQEEEDEEEENDAAPEQTPEIAVAQTTEPEPSRRGSNGGGRRGSTGSRRGSSGSGRRRSSCFNASRRNTDKDVADFVSSMMLGGNDLSDLMDDAEIAADYEEE